MRILTSSSPPPTKPQRPGRFCLGWGWRMGLTLLCALALLTPATPALAVGEINTVAGTGVANFSGDSVSATTASLNSPINIAVDAAGNRYIADHQNQRIRKLTQAGFISTVAGNGAAGFNGDNIPASNASLNYPTGAAVDGAGNLYIADMNNQRIRKVTTAGIISTVAGNGGSGFSGDNIPASNASLNNPTGIAVDGAGNLYIADRFNHRIRKVTTAGIISTVAGTGVSGFSGDGGAATNARLLFPRGVAVDGAGNLYIADMDNHRIRKVTSAGIISTVAGNGNFGFSGDGGSATTATLYLPAAVVVDAAGNLLIADEGNSRIRKVTPAGIISTMAGNGTPSFNGDNIPATSASLRYPDGVAVDSAGNLFIADTGNHRIRQVNASDGKLSTVAGYGNASFNGDSVPATAASLNSPDGLAVDGAGNLFIADYSNHRIRKLTPAGTISTVAGTGSAGFSGDGGPATSANLRNPGGVAVDGAGNLFIAEYQNHRIRKVNPAGIISTVAGNGVAGFSGDGAPATSASLQNPHSVAVDGAGNLFIADYHNHRIRKVNPAGIINTVAGTGVAGFSGDGGAATAAALNNPHGVATDGAGNLYIADVGNQRIRKVTPAGIISTVAGNGVAGFSGDGGAATAASFSSIPAVAVDAAGNLLLPDYFNHRVRQVTAAGIISTVAGNGVGGFGGDGGAATAASMTYPGGVAVDAAGNLFIAEYGAHRIRKVTGIVAVAGTPEIDVQGNGLAIASGDTTPSLDDHSDFGSASVNGGTVARTFSIRNTGDGPLIVNPPTLSGANASDFTLSLAPANSVAAAGSTILQLTFAPSALGSRTATIALVNSDSNENPYTFTVQGNGANADPSLTIPNTSQQSSDRSFTLPIVFTSQGAAISALGFSLDYDQTCLTYGQVSGLPAGFVNSVNHDLADSDGEIDVAIWDPTEPIAVLSDGTVATLALSVKAACVPVGGGSYSPSLSFSNSPAASFGNSSGATVNGTASVGTISITFNQAPTSILLNPSAPSVAENQPVGTSAGTLTAADLDVGDTHSFALVAGAGDTDNAAFSITGNTLNTAQVLDYENQAVYSVRIRATDSSGLNVEQAVLINLAGVNEAPTAITSANLTVAENQPSGTLIATFVISDPENNWSGLTLVAGAGDSDNAAFTVDSGALQLLSNAVFNYETQPNHQLNIRLRATDSAGLFYEEAFVVNVTNVNDLPSAGNDDFSQPSYTADGTTLLDVLSNDTDEDGSVFSIGTWSAPLHGGSVMTEHGKVRYTPALGYNGPDSFTYVVYDGESGQSTPATVSVTAVAPDPRGDCNADGSVNAGDFTAIVLEYFDSDGNSLWYDQYSSGFGGSPRGCDANASNLADPTGSASAIVTVADVSCAVLTYFGDPACQSPVVQAAQTGTTATLTAAADLQARAGESITVPVRLTSNGNAVAALGFSLRFAGNQFSFDATDANDDGLPDAITLLGPANLLKLAVYDRESQTLKVALAGLTAPLPVLPDGVVAQVRLTVSATPSQPQNVLWLADASLGNNQGQAIPVAGQDGQVQINGITYRTFLPLTAR